MRLPDLTPGQIFTLEGKAYETQYVSPSGRVVMCYLLRQLVHDEYTRIPDPNDLNGDTHLTTFFSDLRFNREHETDEDRELDSIL